MAGFLEKAKPEPDAKRWAEPAEKVALFRQVARGEHGLGQQRPGTGRRWEDF